MALVELAKYYNSFEAGVAQGRLAAAGIETHMFDFNTSLEGIGFLIPVRLMVDDQDLDAALGILAD
jgi:hypothetical protein